MDKEFRQYRIKDQTLPDFSSPALFQVKDSDYERHLRTLNQVQEKRATILKKLRDQDNLTLTQDFDQRDNGSLEEISLEQDSKSPGYTLPPLRYFTPVEKAEINDVTDQVVKPTPRHVNVVRPVQYPGRICHPVPQALRRPPGSSPAYGTDSTRLPLKKRRYIPTQEDVGPSSKVGKMAAIDHHETSGFCSFVPAHAMDEYFREFQHREERKTAEDKDLWSSDVTVETVDDDKEVAELFDAKQDLKIDYCNFPWISDITDDTMTATNRRKDVLRCFIQQISPVIISLSPGSSSSNQSNRATPIYTVSNMSQNNQADRNDFDYGIISADGKHLGDKGHMDSQTIPEPEIGHTEVLNKALNSDALISSGPKRTMESLRRMVMTNEGSADHPSEDRISRSEEEQFAEILEDFLEENKDLPPQINDVILDMLTNVTATVAEQKESILYTAEIYMGESDDELGLAECERSADRAPVVQAKQTSFPDPQSFSASESPLSEEFEEMNCIEVEMDNTGQRIYDEIAAFFGYDGYIDYLSYETSTAVEETDQNTSYEIDNTAILLE